MILSNYSQHGVRCLYEGVPFPSPKLVRLRHMHLCKIRTQPICSVSGIKYKDLCPAEIWIPRYMIVMGLTQIITIWLKIMHFMYLHACDLKDNLCTFAVAVLTVLWNFGWLIAGICYKKLEYLVNHRPF